VVLLDGAGWHQTGGKLELPANISLLKLPAFGLRYPNRAGQDYGAIANLHANVAFGVGN
jgi:hypothetical protein